MAGEERREKGAVVVREEKDTYFVWLAIMFQELITHEAVIADVKLIVETKHELAAFTYIKS